MRTLEPEDLLDLARESMCHVEKSLDLALSHGKASPQQLGRRIEALDRLNQAIRRLEAVCDSGNRRTVAAAARLWERRP